MNPKTSIAKLSIVLSIALVFALVTALLWQSKADAQGKKTFKGATLENNRLVPNAGLKMRKISDTLVEIFKEESTTTGSGPTARRVTKPVRVNGINVKCVCGGTTNSTNCTTNVSSGGATCSIKNNSCSKCEMIATE